MKKNTQKNKRIEQLKPIVVLIGFSAIMLIISTYAWFSTQRAVTITNLSGTVNVAEGLEISLDGARWNNAIDLSNASLTELTTAEKLGTYSTTANHVPTELVPASTIGAPGGKVLNMWTGTYDGTTNELSSIKQCNESTATPDATEAYAGYYAFDIFLKNSSSSENAQQIFLSEGSAITVLSSDNGGDETTGLQNTVRLALAKYNATADVNALQSEIISATVTSNPNISQVVIWEPNANYHVNYMVSNSQRYGNQVTSRNQLITTFALNDTSVDTIANVYDIAEATRSSKLTQQKTVKTSIEVPESTEVLPTVYATSDKVALTDTSASEAILTLDTNKVTRARVYIWLEGQDVDCMNYASHGGGITVNFGLEKE